MKSRSVGGAEIRKHYFLNQYTVIAPMRQIRPDSFGTKSGGHKQETPSAPSIERDPAVLTIPGDDGKWAVRVIDNKFPALTLDNPKAYGKQEIVVETPDHNLEFSELSIEQILRVFQAYRERITTLGKIKDIRYVSVFKNDGAAAGASIAHAHSQIVALPLIPPELELEAEAEQRYADEHQSCAMCDALTWESKQKVRVLYDDKSILAITPYASRYSFEVWIIPKRHLGQFNDLKHDENHSIAIILKNLTSKLDSLNISYNFFLQNALPQRDHHFMLKLEPRPNVWAGLELGTDVILNPVSPEYAALWYQNKV